MRRKLRQGLLLVAAVAIGLLAPQAGAATILIDDFDFDSGNGTNFVYDTNQASDPLSIFPSSGSANRGNIFRGSRDLFVQINKDPSITSSIQMQTSSHPSGGGIVFELHHSSAAPDPIAPDVAHITWDGASTNYGSTPDLTGSIDLLGGSALGDAFFTFTSNSWNTNRQVAVEVWSTGNASSSYVPFVLAAGNNQHSLGFDDLGFSGFNFASVSGIRLHFLTDEIQLYNFSVENAAQGDPQTTPVPVPAAAGLGILGMAVVAGFRRRSSANVA